MVQLTGIGLFTGTRSAVTLRGTKGAVVLRAKGRSARLSEWVPTAQLHSSGVSHSGELLQTVEHLFGALCGLGIYRGVDIEVAGGEVPLIAFVGAIDRLQLVPSRPALEIVRSGAVHIGESTYTFTAEATSAQATSHAECTYICARAKFSHTATFSSNDLHAFRTQIASARTFILEEHVGAYLAAGQSATLAPEHVVVLGDVAHSAGAIALDDEPARHKLLDMLGDFYAYGGLPAGHVHALRPGHANTHAAIRVALGEGILRRRSTW
jgi:UDP-3-O-[3-hydroxymyristoyl] N-acetylglucosamine deacetylase